MNEANSNNLRSKFIIIIMAQVLTTAIISLGWTCLLFIGVIISEDSQGILILRICIISFYCYHLNNVKSFYVSMVASPTFRRRFIKSCINLVSCFTCQRRQLVNTNNSTRTITNNREEIPLQSI